MTTMLTAALLATMGGQDGAIAGWRVEWVSRPVVAYETRTVWREVRIGRDRCGRPVYARRPRCERVPVTRWEQVCERRPVYAPRCERPRLGFRFGIGW